MSAATQGSRRFSVLSSAEGIKGGPPALDYGERYRNLHDVSVLSLGGKAKPAE